MTLEECCDNFAVAVKSSKVQHAQAVLTLSDPGLRPESKTRPQTKRVIAYRCHDSLVAEEPDKLVTPMASCGFFHIDNPVKIELEFADVVHLGMSRSCSGLSKDSLKSIEGPHEFATPPVTPHVLGAKTDMVSEGAMQGKEVQGTVTKN